MARLELVIHDHKDHSAALRARRCAPIRNSPSNIRLLVEPFAMASVARGKHNLI